MQDLSNNKYSEHALALSSQAAGNTVDDRYRELTMTAPGSEPVNPSPIIEAQDDPHIDLGTPKKLNHLVANEATNKVPAAPKGWSKI
jgi:hypothetical protein